MFFVVCLKKMLRKLGTFNDKKEMRLLILLGISIILANLVLRLILRPLPENIGYLIKTLGLMCLYYFLVQRRLGLKIKSTKKIRWSETLGVCWFLLLADFFYVSAVALGISKAPHMIGTALVIALGAGFFEEYFFRGLFLKLAFQDGIRSFKTGFRSRSLVCLIFWFGPSRESHSSTLECYPVPSLLCDSYRNILCCYLPTYW